MGRPGGLRVLLGLCRLGCAVFCPPLGPAGLSELRTPEVQTRSSSFRVCFRQVSKRVKFTQVGVCQIHFRLVLQTKTVTPPFINKGERGQLNLSGSLNVFEMYKYSYFMGDYTC